MDKAFNKSPQARIARQTERLAEEAQKEMESLGLDLLSRIAQYNHICRNGHQLTGNDTKCLVKACPFGYHSKVKKEKKWLDY